MNGLAGLALAVLRSRPWSGRRRRSGRRRSGPASPSIAPSSRCLISIQLLRLPRSSRFVRTSTHDAVHPLAFHDELQLALCRAPRRSSRSPSPAPSSRGPTASPCRRRTGPWGWCPRSRRSRAGGPRPPSPGAGPSGRARGPWAPPRTGRSPSYSSRRSKCRWLAACFWITKRRRFRGQDLGVLARRLGRLREVPHLLVLRELLGGHDRSDSGQTGSTNSLATAIRARPYGR